MYDESLVGTLAKTVVEQSYANTLAENTGRAYHSLTRDERQQFDMLCTSERLKLAATIRRAIDAWGVDAPLPGLFFAPAPPEPKTLNTDEMVEACSKAGVDERDASVLCAMVESESARGYHWSPEQYDRADRALQTVLLRVIECESASA